MAMCFMGLAISIGIAIGVNKLKFSRKIKILFFYALLGPVIGNILIQAVNFNLSRESNMDIMYFMGLAISIGIAIGVNKLKFSRSIKFLFFYVLLVPVIAYILIQAVSSSLSMGRTGDLIARVMGSLMILELSYWAGLIPALLAGLVHVLGEKFNFPILVHVPSVAVTGFISTCAWMEIIIPSPPNNLGYVYMGLLGATTSVLMILVIKKFPLVISA